MSRILADGEMFTPYDYESEAEFEREVVEHAKALFGEETLYIDVKKKIGQDIVTIPDGYLIDSVFMRHDLAGGRPRSIRRRYPSQIPS
jgi:hypothetical protein